MEDRDLDREIEEILNSSLTLEPTDNDTEILVEKSVEHFDYESEPEVEFDNQNELTTDRSPSLKVSTKPMVALDHVFGRNSPKNHFIPIYCAEKPGTLPNFNRVKVKSVYTMNNLEKDKLIQENYWCKADVFSIDYEKPMDFWKESNFYEKMIYLSGQRMIRTWPMDAMDRAGFDFESECVGSSYLWRAKDNTKRSYFIPLKSVPIKMELRPKPIFSNELGSEIANFTVHWVINYVNKVVENRFGLYMPEMKAAEAIKWMHCNPSIDNSFKKLESLMHIYSVYAESVDCRRKTELLIAPDVVTHRSSRSDCDDIYLPTKSVAEMEWKSSGTNDPFKGPVKVWTPDHLKTPIESEKSDDDDDENCERRERGKGDVIPGSKCYESEGDNGSNPSNKMENHIDAYGNKQNSCSGSNESTHSDDEIDYDDNSDLYRTDSQDSFETARMKKKRRRNRKRQNSLREWLDERKREKEVQKFRDEMRQIRMDDRLQLSIGNNLEGHNFLKNRKSNLKPDYYFERGWNSPPRPTMSKPFWFKDPNNKNIYGVDSKGREFYQTRPETIQYNL